VTFDAQLFYQRIVQKQGRHQSAAAAKLHAPDPGGVAAALRRERVGLLEGVRQGRG
jgi:hypothetical protein